MRRLASFSVLLAAGGALALAPGLVQASARGAAHVCSGTSSKPGVLAGTFGSGVVVKGFCQVNSGPANVSGTVQVSSGSVLIAAFGMKNSRLSVKGDVSVEQGATLILGCNTTSFPCVDDPNQSAPTLTSPGTVTGDVTEKAPLGVVIHSSTIGGSITETSGGGGVNCNPSGPFAGFQSPVFSDYEDNTISGNVTITNLTSCWLGVIRNHIGRSLKVNNNSFADPDAIEIEKNVIRRDLVCRHNKQHVWDSADASPTGALYPRQIGRNKVGHYREGQCLTASPLTPDGVPAGGPF